MPFRLGKHSDLKQLARVGEAVNAPFLLQVLMLAARFRRRPRNRRTSVSATKCNKLPHGPIEFYCPEWLYGHVLGFYQAPNSRAAISWGSRFGVADDADNLGNIVSYLTLDGIDEAVDVGD